MACPMHKEWHKSEDEKMVAKHDELKRFNIIRFVVTNYEAIFELMDLIWNAGEARRYEVTLGCATLSHFR